MASTTGRLSERTASTTGRWLEEGGTLRGRACMIGGGGWSEGIWDRVTIRIRPLNLEIYAKAPQAQPAATTEETTTATRVAVSRSWVPASSRAED
eukprot:6105971-Prymnesium_polylepis.1